MEDKESAELFFRDCCTKDTIYYDEANAPTSKGQHSSYAVACKLKYSADNSYRKYNAKNEKLVSFEVKNNDTVFALCPSPPVYPEKEEYITMVLTNNAIPQRQETGNLAYIWTIVTFTVLKNGENSDIICRSNLGANYNRRVEAVFKKYIKNGNLLCMKTDQ